MCFDIEHNTFWLKEWGAKPASLDAAFEIARHAVARAPLLIPICGHRYIPANPPEAGNPVFSVYQTDIIYYGAELIDYLQNEYGFHFGRPHHLITKSPRFIEFWTRVAEENGEPRV